MSADPASSDVPGLKNSLVRPKPKPAGRRSPEKSAGLEHRYRPASQPKYGADYLRNLLRPGLINNPKKLHILYSEYSCQ